MAPTLTLLSDGRLVWLKENVVKDFRSRGVKTFYCVAYRPKIATYQCEYLYKIKVRSEYREVTNHFDFVFTSIDDQIVVTKHYDDPKMIMVMSDILDRKALYRYSHLDTQKAFRINYMWKRTDETDEEALKRLKESKKVFGIEKLTWF